METDLRLQWSDMTTVYRTEYWGEERYTEAMRRSHVESFLEFSAESRSIHALEETKLNYTKLEGKAIKKE